jgi:hypothetical protein
MLNTKSRDYGKEKGFTVFFNPKSLNFKTLYPSDDISGTTLRRAIARSGVPMRNRLIDKIDWGMLAVRPCMFPKSVFDSSLHHVDGIYAFPD